MRRRLAKHPQQVLCSALHDEQAHTPIGAVISRALRRGVRVGTLCDPHLGHSRKRCERSIVLSCARCRMATPCPRGMASSMSFHLSSSYTSDPRLPGGTKRFRIHPTVSCSSI
jgi:hypothetical protein